MCYVFLEKKLVPSEAGDASGKINWGDLNKGHLRSYRCEVINYAIGPLFNLEFFLGLRFFEVIRKANSIESGKVILTRHWIVPIPKIDPGKKDSFVFYLQNLSPHFVDVTLPSSATIHSKRENEGRLISVGGATPEVMHFPPNDMSLRKEAGT